LIKVSKRIFYTYVSLVVITFILTQVIVLYNSYFIQSRLSYGLEKTGVEEVIEKQNWDPYWGRYTKEEITLLEKIVMAEAYGEPFEGKVAVVNVILNRVNSPCYPDTIKEVVFQPGQFNPTWDGSLERVREVTMKTKIAVNKGLLGYQVVPENTLFFLNKDIANDFTIPNTRVFVEKIGNHSFYR
jgi:N-acetylmuramoyl-L-alanine amidase